MFKIGQFAQLAQVSIRVLRYYDELGLLKPAHLDESSGYRYYTLEQLPHLHRILALKDLGLSLEEVARLIHENLSLDEMRGMLLLKQAQLRQHLADEQAKLIRVEERLRYLEQAGKMPDLEMVIRSVDPVNVISVRSVMLPQTPPRDFFLEAWCTVRHTPIRRYIEKTLGIYHTSIFRASYPEFRVRTRLIEAAYVLSPDCPPEVNLPTRLPFERRSLHGLPKVVCAIHKGSDLVRGEAHFALQQWREAHGYRLSSAVREVYLRRDPQGHDHITEIQHPIEEK